MGLLMGRNPAEGLGYGLQQFQQISGDRRQEQRQARRDQMDQQRYDLQAQQYQTELESANAAQEQLAKQTQAFEQYVNQMPVDANVKQFILSQGPDSEAGKQIMKSLFPDPADAPTVKDFYEGGHLVQKQWDGSRWVEVGRGSRWQPQQAPQDPERVRLAKEAGLVPGTPQYQQFLLGRDDTPPGLFQGTGMDQQAMNVVLRGQSDPSYRNTPEYAAAWNQLYEQPKIITTPDPNDPTRLVQMQIMMPKPQGFQGPGGATPTAAPNIPQMPSGSQSSTASVIPGTSVIPQQEAKDLRKFEAEADAMLAALDTFENTVTNASVGDFADSFAGGFTEGGRKLSTDWANAALLSKAESLYNLGVLNGPDLDIIRNTLTDPSTFKGQITGKDAYKASIASVRKLIKDRVATKRKGMNLPAGDEEWTVIDGVKIRRKN
uniref:hypothetical protein n=1 Tax=Nitrospira cf. moscoviensis SBR1015 TaxID=96242 RepID=UPI00111F0935|nr:hypothetical protein [Nitrospira cf. moscoviensis SBR1015]